MTCNEVRDNLVAYLHGELEKKTVMALHQHLGRCEACVQEERELQQTSRMLDQFSFEVLPDNFDERLQQKLNQIEGTLPKVQHDVRRIVYAIAATILIIVGIHFLGTWIFQATQPALDFKDFPTTQAVFKSVDIQSGAELSLKERLVQRYVQPSQSGKLKIERNE